jgi:cyclophilin family peptidyl-prolyl cis-trans isomerase
MKRLFGLAVAALAMSGAAFAQETAQPLPVPAEGAWTGPEVTLHTTMGDIVITLDPVGAPKTSALFLGLAKAKYFDGAAVYRVEPGFVVQLGDLDAKLQYREPPLPPVPLETATNHHELGAVAMAHGDDPNDGRGVFYFDMGDNSGLGATPGQPPNTTGYAVFGHITQGWDVARAIEAAELAPEGGPFPGKLPKNSIVVTKAVITKE